MTEYKDKFTEAEKELSEKSAYVCESCNKTYKQKEANEADMACCGRTLKELHEEAFGP